ncbi:MAG: hypothetical protein J6W74_00070 [Bacteroidales bacterium]|nr:hypothetical protein [Bacteroidales bacterium]MBP5689289.1 hypothetical protein [Bacteroidales bacterium]
MQIEFINPGDLDRRINIVRPVTTIGDKGQEVVTHMPLCSRFASVDIDASDEDVEDDNVRSVRWLDIVMYRLPVMLVTDEIEFENRRYNITSINEIRRTPFIRVRAREVLRYE